MIYIYTYIMHTHTHIHTHTHTHTHSTCARAGVCRPRLRHRRPLKSVCVLVCLCVCLVCVCLSVCLSVCLCVQVFAGRDRGTGVLKWNASRVDLLFGANSELRTLAELYACDDSRRAFVVCVRCWLALLTCLLAADSC